METSSVLEFRAMLFKAMTTYFDQTCVDKVVKRIAEDAKFGKPGAMTLFIKLSTGAAFADTSPTSPLSGVHPRMSKEEAERILREQGYVKLRDGNPVIEGEAKQLN